MGRAAGREVPEPGRPSELERLGDELCRLGDELGCRDISVTLGPDTDDQQVLEVVNRRATAVGVTRAGIRVWRQAGTFWWASGEEDLGSEEGIRRAAGRIAAALQWSRQCLRVPAAPDSS
jgi:hypothetical protein